MNIVKIRKINEIKNRIEDLEKEQTNLINQLRPFFIYDVIQGIKTFSFQKTVESYTGENKLKYERLKTINEEIKKLKGYS